MNGKLLGIAGGVILILVGIIGWLYDQKDEHAHGNVQSAIQCCKETADRVTVLERRDETQATSKQLHELERNMDGRFDGIERELILLRSEVQASMAATGSVARSVNEIHRTRQLAGGG